VARSTQLGDCIAGVLGIRPTTVASHVRNLREAGLLTKTGRGITGAHMTPLDGARLLIAATCSQDVQDSVETLHRYGKLTHLGKAVQEDTFPTLSALGDHHSFAAALATLLDGPSVRLLADDPKSVVLVTFNHPIHEVLLEVSTHGWEIEREYKRPWPGKKPSPNQVNLGDRQIRYSFSEKTIFTVGNLIRGED
jgi:hypothetical protein